MSKLLNRHSFILAPIAAFFAAKIPGGAKVPGEVVTFYFGCKSEVTSFDKLFDQVKATADKLCRLNCFDDMGWCKV